MGSHHPLPTFNYHRRFLMGTLLKLLFIGFEFYYGALSNSVTLVSDALHNIGDSLGLLIAWGGYFVSQVKPTAQFTFGLKNTTLLTAFINAVLIFVAVGGICWESIQRIGHPQPIDTSMVLIVTAIGLPLNCLVAWMFFHGKKDINLWGAFLHMAGDVAVSVAVIISTLGIVATGWWWLDPVTSLLISLLIVISAWGLFKESSRLMLLAVPKQINFKEVSAYLRQQPEVVSLHDLHIWAMSSTEVALTVHLVTSQHFSASTRLHAMAQELQDLFDIHHVTIQLENDIYLGKCQTFCD